MRFFGAFVAASSIATAGIAASAARAQLEFDAARAFDLASGGALMSVGDVNEHGLSDVLLDSGGRVSVLLSDGSGGFIAAPSVSVPNLVLTFVLGDFDEDGHIDIAAGEGTDRIALCRGTGAATFLSPLEYSVGFGADKDVN